jgi:hypothetical protein
MRSKELGSENHWCTEEKLNSDMATGCSSISLLR